MQELTLSPEQREGKEPVRCPPPHGSAAAALHSPCLCVAWKLTASVSLAPRCRRCLRAV
jgi:hypothetical protein